ncbi:MAG TPA: acyltransferase [Acidobacteriaceae bacterium]|nr:acyltransferase [Acidobacteriaceae bacterium]
MSTPPAENGCYYPALDGLRAVSMLMIFQIHYLPGLLNWGWAGVDFFFVLSGFLITGILYDTRETAHRLRNFYGRRVLRIFPLYYGVLLIGWMMTPIFHWIWHPAWILWPLYLGNYARFIWIGDFTRTGGPIPHLWSWMGPLENLYSPLPFKTPVILMFQHFWSLCIEEQFYLIWPPVVFLIGVRTRLRDLCLAMMILVLAARVICLYTVPPLYLGVDLLYRTTIFRLDALLFGGMLALMLRGPEAVWLIRFRKLALVVILCGFATFEIAYRVMAGRAYPAELNSDGITTLGLTALDLLGGALLLVALDEASIVYRLLTLKPLRRLGKISYGFYVLHQIPEALYSTWVRRFYGHFGLIHGQRFAFAALGFSATLVLSILSFRFFEQPFLRMKSRFVAVPREALQEQCREVRT